MAKITYGTPKGKTRLVVNIPSEVHLELRRYTANEHMTLTEAVEIALRFHQTHVAKLAAKANRRAA